MSKEILARTTPGGLDAVTVALAALATRMDAALAAAAEVPTWSSPELDRDCRAAVEAVREATAAVDALHARAFTAVAARVPARA